MILLLLRVVLLSDSATSAFTRACPVEERNKCKEDTWMFTYLCCGDFHKSEDCCKAFTNELYVVAALGYGVFIGLIYMLFRRRVPREPAVLVRRE